MDRPAVVGRNVGKSKSDPGRDGRLVEQTSSLKPGSRTVKLAIAYDAWGNQREITHHDDSVAKRTVTFGIDAWGRVTETVTTADGEIETRTEKVTYDNAGRVVAQTHPETGGVGTGISALPKAGYRYDPLGRLTHVATRRSRSGPRPR